MNCNNENSIEKMLNAMNEQLEDKCEIEKHTKCIKNRYC